MGWRWMDPETGLDVSTSGMTILTIVRCTSTVGDTQGTQTWDLNTQHCVSLTLEQVGARPVREKYKILRNMFVGRMEGPILVYVMYSTALTLPRIVKGSVPAT